MYNELLDFMYMKRSRGMALLWCGACDHVT
jgi:hypothetical protein